VKWSEYPILDDLALNQLLALSQPDSQKMLDQLFELFAQEMPERIKACQMEPKQGNLLVVRELGHTLKSSTRQMGAHRLSELCAALEEAAIQEDLDEVQCLSLSMEATYEQAHQALVKWWKVARSA